MCWIALENQSLLKCIAMDEPVLGSYQQQNSLQDWEIWRVLLVVFILNCAELTPLGKADATDVL